MTTKRKPKSVKIDRPALKEYRKQFDTDVACAEALGIGRTVLVNVLLRGTGSADTAKKIQRKLQTAK